MILRFVPKEIVKEFLEKLSSEKQKACELLLRYPLQCVGAWMQVEIITIHEDSTIQDAINLIKNYKREALLDLIYVLNDSKQLLGTSKISSILRDDPELSIRASLDPVLTPSISANSPLKAVKKHKYWETNDFLTIVDKQKKFIGILRHQDLLKALSTFTITDDTNFSKDDLAKEFCEVYSHSMVELFNLGSKVVFKPKHAN